MYFSIEEMIEAMIERDASDLHLINGIPPTLRIYGDLKALSTEALTGEALDAYLQQLVKDGAKRARFLEERELDFGFEVARKARFRVNAYVQRGSIAFSIRLIPMKIPRLEDLHLPSLLRDLTRKPNGLVLVTGPTGSGKSTTLASMIDFVNQEQSVHIVTVEDPIEYVYQPRRSIISQREVGDDTTTFAEALRHVLRQDPDVILIGEARDLETMQAAITAAETGHLVFSTLHTTTAPQTIDRIIDMFPPYQQGQVRSQLSMNLQAVVSQRLLKSASGKGRIPATEILISTPGISNLIREGKTHQIYNAMELGSESGMHTMEADLTDLVSKKLVQWQEAQTYSRSRETSADW